MEQKALKQHSSTSPFHLVSQQLVQLQERSISLKNKISRTTLPTKQKLTTEQKNMRTELRKTEQEIKKLSRSLKKLTAIQEASKKVGKEHGNILLYGVHYYW